MKINSTPIDFRPTISRVLNRPFIPASPDKVSNIIDRVLSFTETETEAQLASLRRRIRPPTPQPGKIVVAPV